MKIRTDFITNSSSSAFVIIGVKVNELGDYDEINALLEKNKLDCFWEEKVIGKVIASLDLENYDSVSMNILEVQSTIEEVKNSLNKMGIYEEVKLIMDVFAT